MRFLMLVACAGVALAQVGGPVLGLVPDGEQIRVMYGLPAAGAVGPSIAAGFANIAISPAQNYAIATDSNGAADLVLPTGAISPIAGTAANASRIAISPAGSAAALWIPSDSHFEILTGLPAGASVQEIDATAFGPPIAFAVCDDGHLAGSFASGVELFGTDGSVTPVAVADRVMAIAFFAGNTNLAMATATRVISMTGGTATVLYEAGSAEGRELLASRSPAGIAVSIDNRWIAAAMRDGGVVTVNVASGAASKTSCGCVPEGVFGIGGPVFRLTSKGVKLIDASSGNFLDVPPAAGAQP